MNTYERSSDYEIPLTRGYKTVVDKDLYRYLNQWKWTVNSSERNLYAIRKEYTPMIKGHRTSTHYSLHTEIMKYCGHCVDGKVIAHINGDTLDNRLENLRLCSNSENQRNSRMRIDNTSGFKGVFWHKSRNKWLASIRIEGKLKHLGYFEDKKEAALAYNEAALELHGEFARLNQL